MIDALLTDGREQGFDYLSVSGGEPLLWRGLTATLARARSLGFTNSLTTNAMLASPDRARDLVDLVDAVGISIDGPELEHNTLRGSRHAYTSMLRGAEQLVTAGVACGFVFTLTQHNLHQLEQIIDLAATLGLRFVQIHPMETAGKADEQLVHARPDADELWVAAWNVARLYETAMARGVQLLMDAVDVQRISLPSPDQSLHAAPPRTLSELLDAIVVEPDGWVVPLSYGFDRRLAIGDLHRERLSELATTWQRDAWPRLQAMERHALQSARERQTRMVNWTEDLRRVAAAHPS